jgi:hyperosmotically inducible protein
MTQNATLRNVCTVLLTSVLLASAAMGCSTAQSPNRQAEDVKITAEVKAKLASDLSPSTLANIEVNTTNGVVTLAGQVESEQLRQSAQTVAASVPGVAQVNNNLQVDAASVAQ